VLGRAYTTQVDQMPEKEEKAKPSTASSDKPSTASSVDKVATAALGVKKAKKQWIKPSERKRLEEEEKRRVAEEAERKAEEKRQAAELAKRKAEEEERRRREQEERDRIRRAREEEEFLRTSLPPIAEAMTPLPKVLEDADWAVIVRGMWHEAEDIQIGALKAIRAACKNKFRANQSVFACTKDAMTRLVALLAGDDSDDILNNAALALAALCNGAYRPCQDALAMTGNGMAYLAALLSDEQTAQAGALAIGHACHFHRGNQDGFSLVPDAAVNLLDLIEDEDGELARTAEFAVFWAVSDANKGTRTLWERAQGNCQSLEPPGAVLHEWEIWPQDQRDLLQGKTKSTRLVKNFGRTSRMQANLAHVNLARAARRASARMGLPLQDQAATEANMERAFRRASKRLGLPNTLGLPATPEHSQSETDLRTLSKASRASVDYRTASKMSVSPQDLRSASKMTSASVCMIGAERRSVSKTGFMQPMSEGKRNSICV